MQKSKKELVKTDQLGKVTKKRKGISQCPFYKQHNIDDLRDSALLDIQDVEDLVNTGKEIGACPYYASRKAAKDAQVVLVPYNTLLHKATREANGIKLKNNVVIIDEAHNLLEALGQMYSSSVTHFQLYHAHCQVMSYKGKYSTRFSSNNLLCINQLIFVVKKLLNVFGRLLRVAIFFIFHIVLDQITHNKNDPEIFSVQDFVLKAGIDNYNMFKLLKFCRDSKITQKVKLDLGIFYLKTDIFVLLASQFCNKTSRLRGEKRACYERCKRIFNKHSKQNKDKTGYQYINSRIIKGSSFKSFNGCHCISGIANVHLRRRQDTFTET